MRRDIVHEGADKLKYEIREIINKARKLENMGVDITWENIGDPVAKGEKIPDWIKDIIKKAIDDDSSFGYSPTKGLEKTREFIAELRNIFEGAHITKEDVVFFNGLGDAISKIYTYLNFQARIIGPSPAYSTHSSAEAAHSGKKHITYNLVPENEWFPDFDDLREKIRNNPDIVGILIINPDNPTGTVYNKEIMQKFADIARSFDLFLICDEIYTNIWHNGVRPVRLSEVVGNDICGISMRGISKEFPWPGARCGWIEVYNMDKDTLFSRYIKTINDAKMLEVCATTLPQKVLPEIMSDERYRKYHKERNEKYGKKAELFYQQFKGIDGLIINKPSGAFYATIVFKENILKESQVLKIENKEIKELVEREVKGVPLDTRFVYYLMASSGICVVPLSGFCSELHGFRLTLLETNEEKFKNTLKTLSEKIEEYIKS
ncbi:MAG: pyridoxal phosphate-dependent aminotransferase [Patescibacteria group bacterium]